MSIVTNVFRRYEKKFLLTESQYASLLPILEANMDYDEHCHEGRPYTVRNVYYDTIDDELIRNSLSKPPFREKIRMRKYGSFQGLNDEVFVEIKRKYRGIGTKRRVRLTDAEAADLLNNGVIPDKNDYYSRQILSEIAYLTRIYPVVPAVFMSYERLAFVDKSDPRFRLTIDRDIRTRRDDYDFAVEPAGLALLPPGHLLMEVKIGAAMPLWFAQTLSALKIYLTSYSKYGKEFEARIRKEIAEDV
jgi:hypothetical protein